MEIIDSKTNSQISPVYRIIVLIIPIAQPMTFLSCMWPLLSLLLLLLLIKLCECMERMTNQWVLLVLKNGEDLLLTMELEHQFADLLLPPSPVSGCYGLYIDDG